MLFVAIPAVVTAMALVLRERVALVSAVLALTIGISQTDINLAGLLWRQPPVAHDNVVLFNWNTRFWNESGSSEFYEYLNLQSADVLQLQERWGSALRTAPTNDDIQQALPAYQIIAQGELVTATRLPVLAVSGDDQRKYLRVDMDVDGDVVSFYNVHVSMPFGADVGETHARRARQLQAIRKDLERNENAVVISGDFNATTAMGVMRWFFRRYQDSARASRSVLPVSWGYHRLPSLRLWRLDYVFLDRRLTANSHESIVPFESDHWAQRVSFRVAN